MSARIPVLIASAALLAPLSAQSNDLAVQPTSGFANPQVVRPERREDRVVVTFTIPFAADELDAALRLVGARLVDTAANGTFAILGVPPGTVDAWVAWLGQQSLVAFAEPEHLAYTCENPDDPMFRSYQWNFYDRGTASGTSVSNYGVQAMTAWNTAKGANTIVAIVDTGVAYESYSSYRRAPDLAGVKFVSPWDFVAKHVHANDDNGHGTHVCGTICQTTNNTLGCAGIANQCQIMPVKVLDKYGAGDYSAIASGITWAVDHGAHVINMSLGGGSNSKALQAAVDYAWSRNVVVCAAAGNSGSNSLLYPARYKNCIAIGATRFDGKRAKYSQYGSGLDVVAPGGDTSVDQNGDGQPDGIVQQTFSGSPTNFGYYFWQGTSMATPHVSAIAALVKSNKPAYNAMQIRAAIQSSCTDLGVPGYDEEYGFGLVNAALALTK